MMNLHCLEPASLETVASMDRNITSDRVLQNLLRSQPSVIQSRYVSGGANPHIEEFMVVFVKEWVRDVCKERNQYIKVATTAIMFIDKCIERMDDVLPSNLQL